MQGIIPTTKNQACICTGFVLKWVTTFPRFFDAGQNAEIEDRKLRPDFASGEKIGVFIDGSNFFATVRALGFDIDYSKLRQYLCGDGVLLRAFYYTALLDEECSPIRPLIDWLDYNGFTMVTKPAKEFINERGQRIVKGNMDIELAIDALEMAQFLDHMILCSGDGDFRRLVEMVQRKGVRVTVVSTIESDPPMVSDDLRRQADWFIDVKDIIDHIRREDRPEPAPPRRPPRRVMPIDSSEASGANAQSERRLSSLY